MQYFYKLTVVICSVILLNTACQEGKKATVFNIPAGFELDDLFAPSENDLGSWVSITEGPDNQFFACDQYGDIYTFQMPGVGEKLQASDIDSIDLNIGYAHGLLWAFNSLYVTVVKSENKDNPDDLSSGVYRLTDQDGNGILDHREKILTVNGTSEHGPHTMRVGPDGESLYLIAGNFNTVPDHFQSRLPRNWNEDNLFPAYLDANGHANELKAPGGWIAKTDPDGVEWELIGAGMRNPFGFGFNEHGEILAYDADMEWDFGMPWYRPTRILHVTSGSEFGWRTGSGKWPVYYPDNLPPVENMAQGSPTAVIMGKDLNFPSKYKNGLFACDWSFGTIYYVDIKEKGSSYSGSREEFLSGVPLPISNAIAGSDGHLYFTTGGRRLDSHLFRVRYTGDASVSTSTSANANEKATELRETRKHLERYHGVQNPEAISSAWPHLNHEDRFVQYAARIAIEHQPLSSWENLLWTEQDVARSIHGALAYARSGGHLNDLIVNHLNKINWASLSQFEKVSLLRTYALLLTRQGMPDDDLRLQIVEKLDPLFPSNDNEIDRTLSQILLFLKAPGTVEKCMTILERESNQATESHPEILSAELLERSEQYGPQIAKMLAEMPPTEAIHYVTMLSHVSEGWTKKLRSTYFEWFHKALSKKGGMSYKAFLDNIRATAMENVPLEDREYFESLSGYYSPMQAMASLAQPKGPGKDYNLSLIGRIATRNKALDDYDGNFEDGKRAYEAALCSSCHRMKGEGSNSGPDLTQINTRFQARDLSRAILSPSEEISDQYQFTLFTLKNDDKLTGRVVNETEDKFTIFQSPFDMTLTSEISKEDVVKTEPSPISPMPSKLLNRLNEDEVRDLFAYLLSGADENHEYYQ